jgi:uncharacterized OB-fold protein
MSKMPCHISDGPQEPEDLLEHPTEDEDEAYEQFRQQKIDDKECMSCNQPHLPNSPYCAECSAPIPSEELT